MYGFSSIKECDFYGNKSANKVNFNEDLIQSTIQSKS